MTTTAVTAASTAAPGTVTTWNIDPAHSAAEFKVKHMMISNVKGKFTGLSGVLKLDETDYTHSVVEASIPTASISTGDDKRDGHLKSADFFDVEKFPAMTFKSKNIDSDGGPNYTVTGDLTIRGIAIRHAGRGRCEPPLEGSLGQHAHWPFRLNQNQPQRFRAGVELRARDRRRAGGRRSDDLAGY